MFNYRALYYSHYSLCIFGMRIRKKRASSFTNQYLEWGILNTQVKSTTGWWFGTFFIFHNIWDNPSHWQKKSRLLKPPTRPSSPRILNTWSTKAIPRPCARCGAASKASATGPCLPPKSARRSGAAVGSEMVSSPMFTMKNRDFTLKNVDFTMKNVDFTS